ncbi:MAG: DeoR/GlpR family DNA-binding transcription regulator [Pseudomonadota bacterium]
MPQGFRHPEILQIIERDGKVTVDGLAAHFGVTLQTIRRDLADLSETKKIERVHGGAIRASGTNNIQYEERRLLNAASKSAIASACAAQIPDNCSLCLNIGTTTEAVARALQGHRGLLVVTNNLNVASILETNDRIETIVTGGRLRLSDGGLVGAMAIESIKKFKFDCAIVGCSALDADGDLLDFDVEEVGVSQAIISQARTVNVVADSSKLTRSAPARIASLSAASALFTDKRLSDALAQRCKGWKTEVIVV